MLMVVPVIALVLAPQALRPGVLESLRQGSVSRSSRWHGVPFSQPCDPLPASFSTHHLVSPAPRNSAPRMVLGRAPRSIAATAAFSLAIRRIKWPLIIIAALVACAVAYRGSSASADVVYKAGPSQKLAATSSTAAQPDALVAPSASPSNALDAASAAPAALASDSATDEGDALSHDKAGASSEDVLHETSGTYLVEPLDVGCSCAWLEVHADLALPRMCIESRKPPMTDDAVRRFLGFIEECFAHEQPFSVLWDVRGKAFPSMAQFRIVINWLDEGGRASKWDDLVQGHALLIPNRIVRPIVRLMASLAKPPQPYQIVATPEEAHAFAREQLTEARSWSTQASR